MHLSHIFLSTLDLSNTFVVISLMKGINFFHFFIFFFSIFFFPMTNINALSSRNSDPGTAGYVSKGLCFSFSFLPKPDSDLLLFSQLLAVHLLLLYEHIKAMFISHSGNLSFSHSQGLPQGQ